MVLIQALLEQLPENNHEAVITIKHEGVAAQPSSNEHDPVRNSLKYDPTVAFILEASTILTTRDDETIETMGKQVFDVLQGILRAAPQWHPITVSRSAFYALKILKASYVRAIIIPG